MARAAAEMSLSGCAIDRAATSASTVPTSSARSAAPATSPCARRTRASTWARSAATRMTPGPPGHGDVHQLAAHRLAPAGGHARPAREREADLGPARMVLDRGERARREVAVRPHAAGPVDEGEAMAVGAGEPVHGRVPAERIGRKGLADEPSLALEPAGDVALEVPPERPLGAPEEDQDRQDEDDDCAEHQPPGQAHLARAPRSVPRNR